MADKEIVALVYRFSKDHSKQYYFVDLAALERWVNRSPYKNEFLNVIPIKGKHALPGLIVHASSAVDFVRSQITDGG